MVRRRRDPDDEAGAPRDGAPHGPGVENDAETGGGLAPEERERRRRQGLEARDGEAPRRRPAPHAGQRHRQP